MTKKNILFVDDEPNILSGLKRMLRSLRKEFDMFFAESGAEALQLMEEHTFDIVVSDMRMPGMDGATLLQKIQIQHPHSIRIMLTGQADDESILRTVGVVHQFLAKPCNPEKLKDVIVRASALHNIMDNGSLKNLVSGIDQLPSLPEVFTRLEKKLKDPETGINEIAEIIEEDVAMSAKVLQLVNSSFFGLYQKADSPARAVSFLGLDTIKALALGVQVFTECKANDTGLSIEDLFAHSLLVATCAKKVAEATVSDKDVIDDSFISGILHDIGKLVLITELNDEYSQIISNAKTKNIFLRDAELQSLKASHCDLGAYLIGLWGLQGPIVEAIGFHHRLDEYPAESFSPALAVHIANTFYYQHKVADNIGAPLELNLSYIEKLGLSDNIDTWQEICQELLERTEDDE